MELPQASPHPILQTIFEHARRSALPDPAIALPSDYTNPKLAMSLMGLYVSSADPSFIDLLSDGVNLFTCVLGEDCYCSKARLQIDRAIREAATDELYLRCKSLILKAQKAHLEACKPEIEELIQKVFGKSCSASSTSTKKHSETTVVDFEGLLQFMIEDFIKERRLLYECLHTHLRATTLSDETCNEELDEEERAVVESDEEVRAVVNFLPH